MTSCPSGSIREIDRAFPMDSIKLQRLCIMCSEVPDKNLTESDEPAGQCPDSSGPLGSHLLEIGEGNRTNHGLTEPKAAFGGCTSLNPWPWAGF